MGKSILCDGDSDCTKAGGTFGTVMAGLVASLVSYLLFKGYVDFVDKYMRDGLGAFKLRATPLDYFTALPLYFLRLRETHLTIPLDSVETRLKDGPGYLPRNFQQLHRPRQGERPETSRFIWHHQIHTEEPRMTSSIWKFLQELVSQYPRELKLDISSIEPDCYALRYLGPGRPTVKGEICHIHDVDGSLHAFLHVRDVNALIEMGFAERHPLSGSAWYAQFPLGYAMIYSPRSRAEAEVVKEAIFAAIAWVKGRRIAELDISTLHRELRLESFQYSGTETEPDSADSSFA